MDGNHALPAEVFKAYDIRGTVPEQLNVPFAHRLGLVLAARARAAGDARVAVGHDGRLSSPALAQALHAGLREGGIDTLDLGLVHTPLVYFATHTEGCGSGVAITGSHNPPNHNGFKLMVGGRTLHGEAIAGLRAEMLDAPHPAATPGHTQRKDLLDAYVQRIAQDVKLARPMHIAIDCGNGVGGVVAERLYRALGCQVDALFTEVDGHFPNHHPDPADPANLQALIAHLQHSDCELGLAFDGDADRLGVVTRTGQIIWPDRQMILYARDVLARRPGAPILFDVKCSGHLAEAIRAAGGEPIMCATGHSLIKARMAETGAALAGEMSGHLFFQERWYGFDDGLYAGARLLEILARHADPSATLEALPNSVATPEIKLPMDSAAEAHATIARLQAHGQFPTAQARITLDGVRAEYAHGFGLARASNTTPVIVLRFEGSTQEALDAIRAEFRAALGAELPGRALGF